MINRYTTLHKGWSNFKNSDKLAHQITEEDRGGIGLHTFMVYDNRYYDLHQNIQVPWTNKDLTIEYATLETNFVLAQKRNGL